MRNAKLATMATLPGNTWDAERYDAQHSFVWRYGSSLVEHLAPKAGERILDIGSGTGHLTRRIADSGALVVGIDMSDSMIEAARTLYPELSFFPCDAQTLHDVAESAPPLQTLLADGSFDAVFSNAVLHWIPRIDLVARGIARLLRPEGRFVAELGGHGNIRRLHGAITAARKELGYPPLAPALHFPQLGSLASTFDTAGLEVVFARLYDRPTPLEGNAGLRNWVETFASHEFRDISAQDRPRFLTAVENHASDLRDAAGAWFADYRRLHIEAYRRSDA